MPLEINKKVIVKTGWQIDKEKVFQSMSLHIPSRKKDKIMINLYDRVIVKSNKFPGCVVSIDDNHGKDVPIYLVEIDDEYKVGESLKDVIWCERDEIELIKKF